MPNWCECDLSVSVPWGQELTEEDRKKAKPELKRFKEFSTTEKEIDGKKETNILDTNKFIPYPEKFRKLDKEAAKAKNPFSVKDGFSSGGYEWCCKNWGTKWGICHAEFLEEGNEELKYEFECAWSPPLPVIKKMSELFPLLEFELRYFEMGCGFKGLYRCENGELTKDETGAYYGSRGG